jgi:7-cyano-7-deazaguanine synthase
MNLSEALNNLPDTKQNVLAVLSGGLDSSVMTMMLVKKYGADRVTAVSYDYGQKQRVELEKAFELCNKLGIRHKILDLNILGDIAKPMSANIGGTNIDMPDIKDVLGDPQPPTYVPFRNLIMLSLTMSVAEVAKASHVFTGLQVHDEYGYWDTSQKFVDSLNAVASQNRTFKVEIVAPFSLLSKKQEIDIANEMGKLELLSSTITCYNPDGYKSCGTCPSCAERIMNFIKAGHKDPIPYIDSFNWDDAVSKYEIS